MTHLASSRTDDALEVLRKIWEDVLKTTVDDIDSDFFEIGGDSIGALKVTALGRRAGLLMPRTAVFRCRSLRALAAAVGDSSGAAVAANDD